MSATEVKTVRVNKVGEGVYIRLPVKALKLVKGDHAYIVLLQNKIEVHAQVVKGALKRKVGTNRETTPFVYVPVKHYTTRKNSDVVARMPTKPAKSAKIEIDLQRKSKVAKKKAAKK
jgi:hypothetical protein